MGDNMSKEKWYQQSLYRLLVDMHIADWNEELLRDFSPEKYAEMMALGKVGTAEVYAGSSLGLCYWPTKIGYRHRQLHGRDLLGETIEACRKRGINVQIYLNVWNRAAYDAHPEWRIVLFDGKGTCEHTKLRFGQCCPNTGFGQYFLSLLDELAASYDCCGYWIDMIGNWHYCYCPACQERFRRESGYDEIPHTADWNDPAWLAFEQCRSNWLNEFADSIRQTVKKRAPERTVTMQSASINLFHGGGIGERFLKANEYLAGDFVGNRIEQSYVCKFFSAMSSNRPIEFMTPRCEDLAYHTTTRSYDNLLMRSYAAIANQASFTLIDAIDPRGTLDRRFYEMSGRLSSSYARFEKYIDGNSEPFHDIAIYHSPASQVDLDHRFNGIPQLEDHYLNTRPFLRVRWNVTGILMGSHQLFTVVSGSDPRKWKNVPVILLCDCMFLSEEECTALEKYVREGGKILATFRTSLYDQKTGIRPDFRLAKLFGIHYTGEMTEPVTYIAPSGSGSIPGITPDYPLMLNSAQVKVTAEPDAEVLGTLTLPISGCDEITYFSAALSNPPMKPTDSPALIRHRYGKGEVIYIAGSLEDVELDFHRGVLSRLLSSLRGRPIVKTNAPPCVECTLFDQPGQKRMIFSCLNLPEELPVLPIRDLTFRLNLPAEKRVTKVLSAPDDREYPFRYDGHDLIITIPELKEFSLMVLQY